jgi:hypothetical protein
VQNDFDLKDIKRISHQNTLKDGLISIGMGVMLFAIGMMMFNTVYISFLPLAIIFNSAILQNLKQKYTYPRLGFVQPQKEKSKDMVFIVFNIAIGCIFILITIILLFFGDTDGYELWWNLLTLGISIILCVQSADFGRKTGNLLYYLVAALFVITGLFFSLLENVPVEEKFSIYLFLWGCTLIGGGLIIFYRFLHTHPAIANEEDYNSGDSM